jgi:hypothetical protein
MYARRRAGKVGENDPGARINPQFVGTGGGYVSALRSRLKPDRAIRRVSSGESLDHGQTTEERIRRAQETRKMLRRTHPGADPDPEDIAALHEAPCRARKRSRAVRVSEAGHASGAAGAARADHETSPFASMPGGS